MFIMLMDHAGADCIFLRDDMLGRFEIPPETLTVHLGLWQRTMKVLHTSTLPPGTIGISRQSFEGMTWPHLASEVLIDGQNLHIGPVLAMLAFPKGETITDEKCRQYLDYFSAYERLNGLVYLCGVDGIDLDRMTIEGYAYNPHAAGTSPPWIRGTFPMPGALYRRCALEPELYRRLSGMMKNRLFNGFIHHDHFDKWAMWQWLSPHPHLRKHLPDTEQLHSMRRLNTMLVRYKTVYLKPTMENMSKGIIQVRRGAKGVYDFLFPENNKKRKAFTIKSMKAPQASRFIASLVLTKGYIIQQAVQMHKYNGRGIDFRVILQKNEDLQWGCTGIIARFGKKNGIVTNFRNAGYAMYGAEALKKAFGYSAVKSRAMLARMAAACVGACKVFEANGGNYADVGVDVMIDPRGKIWILEVNVLPHHTLALYANKKTLYWKQIVKPLLYAKALSGFHKRSG